MSDFKYRNINLLNFHTTYMAISEIYSCSHEPKKYLMNFRCYNGNYSLELCTKCHDQESDEFLIKEEEYDE